MNVTSRLCLAGSLVLGLGLAAGGADAQPTDGYHSIQIFPVAVDSGSFTQRFNFRNPNSAPVSITPRYYPGMNTTGAAIVCPVFEIPANKTVSFDSLRFLCPALTSGSQFGFLYTSELSPESLPYAGYSRVANPQGQGFSVEAFPAHTFTSADSVVNGLRRRAAGGGIPAFQTNCFFANLNEVSGNSGPTTVEYTLYNNQSNVIGNTGVSVLQPGQIERKLDIFGAVGLVAGDYDNAYMKVAEMNPDPDSGEPGIMTFCTVQDNTSFGADFRIGKQETGNGGLSLPRDSLASQDNHVARETVVAADALGRSFEIGTGTRSNTHVVYFRHPDYVQCEILNPTSGDARALPAYGLEMRMLDQEGVIVAGGNAVTGWSDVFLGDKTDRNNGANTRYTIEVEDSETNTGSVRAYKLHCRSGSGHTLGDLIRYQEGTGRF